MCRILALVLMLTFVLNTACNPVNHTSYSLANKKYVSSNDLLKRIQHARKLVETGKHMEALKELLSCYDEGGKVEPSYSRIRILFVISDISKLGKEYQPAMDALYKLRNDAIARVKEKKGTSDYDSSILELAALNNAVGDSSANLNLYDRLKEDNEDTKILVSLQRYVVDELYRYGRTEEFQELRSKKILCPPGFDGDSLQPVRTLNSFPLPNHDKEPDSKLVYQLDQNNFIQRLSNTKDKQERLKVLNERWEHIVLAVSHCDVITNHSFRSSIVFWQSGWLSKDKWSIDPVGDFVKLNDPPYEHANVLIPGDCLADMEITDGGMVHIYGNLDAKISIAGHSEIVIGGNITHNGSIHTNGIPRIFIGGNMNGTISNRRSSMIWIHSDFNGEIKTGRPTGKIHIMGDYHGSLSQLNIASGIALIVRGMMSSKSIKNATSQGYQMFYASIGKSDLPPGLYRTGFDGYYVVHSQKK